MPPIQILKIAIPKLGKFWRPLTEISSFHPLAAQEVIEDVQHGP
jgi:hypothetical protein